MTHQPRRYEPGSLYHLIARGVRRQVIFLRQADYRAFLGMVQEFLVEAGHHVLAYCLMPNHVHLLVVRGEGNLSEAMRRLLHRYACYHNRTVGQTGHVFQGRHRSRLCDDEGYLRTLVRYILQNPVVAGLCTDPASYRWSSLGALLHGESPVRLAADVLLQALDTRDRDPVSAMLRVMTELGDADGAVDQFEEFEYLPSPVEALPPPQPDRPALAELLRQAAVGSRLPPEHIAGRGEARDAHRARVLLTGMAIGAGYAQAEVARYLGRSEAAVSRWVRAAALEPKGPPPT